MRPNLLWALSVEMNLRQIEHKREFEMRLSYKGVDVGEKRIDFLLEDVHLAQAINYLEAYNLYMGLLINFGSNNI
jgi:hypothetical protein